VRPSTVARVVLTVTLALGALPGLAGSNQTNPDRLIDAASYRDVILATARERPLRASLTLPAAVPSDGLLDASTAFEERDRSLPDLPDRVRVSLPQVSSTWGWKPPKSTADGVASFYDNGTTAMRLPRGTVVVICGAAACIERVITDYGPTEASGRLVDLYRPDFFAICGCPSWSGTTDVTVKIY
jgi:hypothetical protein